MPPYTNEEIVAAMIYFLSHDGKYQELTISQLFRFTFGLEQDVNPRDAKIIADQLIATGFVEYVTEEIAITGFIQKLEQLRLTDIGILLLKKHGSYEKYLEFKGEEDKKELKKSEKERKSKDVSKKLKTIQTVFTIVSIAVVIATGLVGIFGKINSRSQQAELDRLSSRLDSLSKSINEQLLKKEQQKEIPTEAVR